MPYSRKDHPHQRPQLFSVVGAAYVPEDRVDDNPARLPQVQQSETAMAGIWLVFYAALIGVSLVTSGGVAKLIEYASALAN
jgi:hypothetical protein